MIQIPADTYARYKQYGGRVGLAQVLGSSAKQFVTGLPRAQLISPQPPSQLYPERNRGTPRGEAA